MLKEEKGEREQKKIYTLKTKERCINEITRMQRRIMTKDLESN